MIPNCIVQCTLRTCKAFGTICNRAGHQSADFPAVFFCHGIQQMKIQLQISWLGQSTSHQWGFLLWIFSPPSLFLWRPLLAPWQPIFEGLSFTFLSEPGRIITLTCLTNSFSTLICHLGSVESTLLTPNSLDDSATDWTNEMLLICFYQCGYLETTTNSWLHSAFGIVSRRIWTLFFQTHFWKSQIDSNTFQLFCNSEEMMLCGCLGWWVHYFW